MCELVLHHMDLTTAKLEMKVQVAGLVVWKIAITKFESPDMLSDKAYSPRGLLIVVLFLVFRVKSTCAA